MALVERDRDVRAILDLLGGVGTGRGVTVLVEGAPGIGKTALLAAVRERAASSDVRALASVGGELERDLPFAIVRQLFEPPLRAASAARRAELLAGAAGLASPVFGYREKRDLSDAVYGLYWLCANLAEDGPLLLAVDDVHWADDASLRFLSYLSRRVSDLPVLLLLAGRPFDGSAFAPQVIRLRPLTEEAVRVVVRQELSLDADEEFCHACAVASGGNPFLLTEALTQLRAAGTRPVAAEAHRLEHLRAETLSRAVLARIARLGPDAVRFARALAVFGSAAQPRHVAALAGLSVDAAASVADVLAREAIVTADRPIGFVHPLLRTAVYLDASSLLRASQHKRAARVLAEEDAEPERLAPHLLAAEPESDPWVVDSLHAAATSAIGHGAPESAAVYLRRARAEPPPAARRGPLAALLGRTLAMAARPDEAAVVLREAITLTEPPAERLRLAIDLGLLLTQTGRADEAGEVAAMARGMVTDDAELPVGLYAEFVTLDLVTLRPPAAVLDRVEAIASRLTGTSDDDRMLLSVLAYGWATAGLRPAARTAELALRAAAGPLPARGAWILVNLASAALGLTDHHAEALELLDRGLEGARELGNAGDFRYLSTLRSHTAWYAGRLIEAEGDARAALERVPGEPSTPSTPLAAAVLVDALVERGELDEARRVLDEYGIGGDQPAGTLIMHFIPMARGRLRLRSGEPAAALADLLGVGKFLVDAGYLYPGFAEWRSDAVGAHLALGQTEAAAALASENLELARSFGAPRSTARALRTMAQVERGERGPALLAEAVDLLAGSPSELEHAHCLVGYGSALRRAGQRTRALDHLRHGLDLAVRCGAGGLAERARQELHAAGARPRRDALSGRDALTASELRVARLAADGATNREIAQTLFVTTRTVEVHLTSTYRKLKIQGRRQLRAMIADPPPDRRIHPPGR
ncbi:ATP-binding protein [Spirillospora sp. NPDC048911]|uniref:ATP-binding protein n=1 Tax=Spirillospora sp. NPDC048911 TaxID=3364527 RepID=UPI0037244E6A